MVSRHLRVSKKDTVLVLLMVILFLFRDMTRISFYGQWLAVLVGLMAYMSRKQPLNFQKKNIKYLLPFVLFWLFSFASVMWASKADYVSAQCFIILRMYALCILLCGYLKTTDDLKHHLKLLWYVGVILLVYLLIKTPANEWMNTLFGTYSVATNEGRIGPSIGYHANEMGTVCWLFLMLTMYWYKIEKGKIYIIYGICLVIVTLFTKSRASILMELTGTIIFYFFSEKRAIKKVYVTLGLCIFIAVLGWMVMNVPQLYQLVGFRLAVFLTDSADVSIMGRESLFNAAMEIFQMSPIFGVGLDNFKYEAYQSGRIWREVYAHSNFAELLADVGIIGTALYYFPQIKSLYIILKKRFKKRIHEPVLRALLLTYLSVVLLASSQKMTYSSLPAIYITFFSIVGTRILWNESKMKL